MNDQEYLTIMAELKFIGSVGENQYINLTNGSIENKNIYNNMIRKIWYKTENGQATARYCRDVIVKAFKLLDRYVAQENMIEYAKTIQKYIMTAKIGMDHLKETHHTNNMSFAIFDSITVAIVQKLGAASMMTLPQ